MTSPPPSRCIIVGYDGSPAARAAPTRPPEARYRPCRRGRGLTSNGRRGTRRAATTTSPRRRRRRRGARGAARAARAAGPPVELELLAPGTHFLNRPAAVAEPFGLGGAATVRRSRTSRRRCRARPTSGTLAAVTPGRRASRVTDAGDGLAYDRLVIAVGARAGRALPAPLALRGPAGRGRHLPAARARERGARQVDRVRAPARRGVDAAALRAGDHDRDRAARPRRPRRRAHASSRRSAHRCGCSAPPAGIALSRAPARARRAPASRPPAALAGGRLELDDGEAVPADAAVVLPPLPGPAIAGCPRTSTASSRSTATAASRARPASSPRATPPRSRQAGRPRDPAGRRRRRRRSPPSSGAPRAAPVPARPARACC